MLVSRLDIEYTHQLRKRTNGNSDISKCIHAHQLYVHLQDAYKSMSIIFSVASGNRYFQKKLLGNQQLNNIIVVLLYHTITLSMCVRTYKTMQFCSFSSWLLQWHAHVEYGC